MCIRMAKHNYNTKLKAYRRHISGQSGISTNGIARVYKIVYACEEPIVEPVDHQMQHQLSRCIEKNFVIKWNSPETPYTPYAQERGIFAM